jgi:hypothetical protein
VVSALLTVVLLREKRDAGVAGSETRSPAYAG